MEDFKIRVVKNIGESSIETFGKKGTLFYVSDGIFADMQGDLWGDTRRFLNINDINNFFLDEGEFETVFELVEEGE